MSAIFRDFPLSMIVDGLISYLQWCFHNPNITPAEYRWDSDDRASRIRICAPFSIDNQKPMSAPFVVVERSGFVFANQIIDNIKSKDAPDGTVTESVDWLDGGINITIGSGVASEASCLANIIALIIQANRKAICSALKFVRNLKYVSIGPEIPVVKYTEVHRWEVTLQLSVSLQFGWIQRQMELDKFNKADIFNTEDQMYSDKGSTSVGSDLFVDTTKNFGTSVDHDPQLLPAELSKNYYYIRIGESAPVYPVAEIVDNHTLRLQYHDESDRVVPWSAPETKSDVAYDLLWNHVHIYSKIPGTT